VCATVNTKGQHTQVKAIYVGNLPDSVTEEKLKDMFADYGQVRISGNKTCLHAPAVMCQG